MTQGVLDGLAKLGFWQDLRLNVLKPCEISLELLFFKLETLFFALFIRPLVLAIFEALVEQQEACLIPEQALDAVLATTAKQEKRRLVRVQMEPRDNQGSKPVDGLPHVRMAAGQIDMIRR